jgi:hypothetical protein
MSIGANGDWGRTFETEACDRLDLRDLAHDDDAQHLDARTTRSVRPGAVSTSITPELQFADTIPADTPVAAKVCKNRIRDGDTTRRGRWCIYREEIEAAGAFAFGVYEVDMGVLPDMVALVPTAEVVARLGEWVDSPHDRYTGVARLPWSAVFRAPDLPAEVSQP